MDSFKGFFANYVTVATVMGRFYGMDRKKEWSRTEMAYNAMVLGEGIHEHSAQDAVLHAYARGESDEFIKPTVIVDDQDKPVGRVQDNDSIIFFNLRSDRARQMCKPFVQENFEQSNKGSFKRRVKPKNLFMVAMTDFGPDLGDLITAFPSREIPDSLPMALRNYRQLAIAENEKYAHVTYFFNGGYADPVAGEKRVIIKSPDMKVYDDAPAMSLEAVIKVVVEGIEKQQYDFITMNIANPDMIAHTGNLAATIKACEYTDAALGKIIDATLKRDGLVIVTADHGNAEEVINIETGEVDTEHSDNPVPFIIVKKGPLPKLRASGKLGDVAPTILQLLGEPKPKLMTGKTLLERS
jgi:2,3-bisphosphoglycerate-independent phosphoglycerate mutase